MLFNSGDFFFFFIAVYLLYIKLPHRGQNSLLLIASYFFYGYWDYRFTILILISTLVDYNAGLLIQKNNLANNKQSAKRWMILSVVVNLGILGAFKYFNFFIDNFSNIANLFGWNVSITTMSIILPAGISFYTFQTISYSIDIYRGKLEPTRHFFDFALFVAFFPQLMAGPIERAKKLIPQIQRKRVITPDHLTEGSWLILWGVFKKVFIADNLAAYSFWSVTMSQAETPADMYIASFAFVIQFYCDFSGYSDMARGLASVMGFKLSLNFNLPYFSTNPATFWLRWHITLSSWLRDYCYNPLAKSKWLTGNRAIALLLTMAIAGLWHGPDWSFILWGVLWGVAIIIYRLLKPFIMIYTQKSKQLSNLIGVAGALITFHIVLFAGHFFVAFDIQSGFRNITFTFQDWSMSSNTFKDLVTVMYYSWPLVIIQVAQLLSKNLNVMLSWPYPARLALYSILLFLLITSGAEGGAEFIYFQF